MRVYRSFKMVLGFSIAVFTAILFKLDFPISAGIITMLNMLDTKKESARVAWKRVYSSFIGLIMLAIIFKYYGNSIIHVIVFLALFTPVAFKLNAREGIAVNAVLASHLFEFKIVTLSHLSNEFALVILGAVVALVVNLHMPNKEKKLLDAKLSIEEKIKSILNNMSCDISYLCTINNEYLSLSDLEQEIKQAKKISYEYMNNYLLKDNRYFLEYFNMRLQQVHRLKYMKERLNKVLINQREAIILSNFTERLAREFEELNDGKELINEVILLKEVFKTYELPKSRVEFEERSALFQYVNDLEEFINIKITFFNKQISYLEVD